MNYLDERPIFEHERMVADAFVRGGEEEVKRVKEEKIQREADAKARDKEERRKNLEEGKSKRKLQLKNMLNELKDKKSEMIKKRENLKEEFKKIPEHQNGDRNRMRAKIQYIDAELQTEYF